MSQPLYFPDPYLMDDDTDIIAISHEIHTELLMDAYRNGIYPWPNGEDEEFIPWFCPSMRGILDFKDYRLPKSFSKWMRNQSQGLHIYFQRDFDQILHHCAHIPRKDQEESWITSQMIKAYGELFDQGHILCCGVFKEEKLVAGLYGVYIDHIFSGESMFTYIPNGSKLALYHLIEFLKTQNIHQIDTQMVTDVIKQFGGKEIPRRDFLQQLKQAKENR